MTRFEQVKKTHSLNKELEINNSFYANQVIDFILAGVKKDLGVNGDISTSAVLKNSAKIVQAKIIAKESGIIAGTSEIKLFLKKFSKIEITVLKNDGEKIKQGDTVITLKGEVKEILKLERTILNLLQRMSGIATATFKCVQKAGPGVLITPTRKTLLGLLDKRACAIGGGGTHRLGLDDAVLIKDTHLDFLNYDFESIFKNLANGKNLGRFIELEVENYQDAVKAIKSFKKYFSLGKPLYLMLDNMKPIQIKKVIKDLKEPNIFFEASGGINFKNISKFAKTGVDIISMGALTNSAATLDLSLKIVN